jgi:hypothetical protein
MTKQKVMPQQRFEFTLSIRTRGVSLEGTATAYGINVERAEENLRQALAEDLKVEWPAHAPTPQTGSEEGKR